MFLIRRSALVLLVVCAFTTIVLTGCLETGGDDTPAATGGGDPPEDHEDASATPAGARDDAPAMTGRARTTATTAESPRPDARADAPPEDAGVALTVRHAGEDGTLVVTVDDATGAFTYRRVVLRVDDAQFTFGAEPSAAAGRFGVDGVTNPDTPVAPGHVLRAPASGDVHVKILLSPSGRALAAFDEHVPDETPPDAPEPAGPANGNTVDEDEDAVTLEWLPVDHAGPVAYDVEYGTDAAFASAERVNGVTGTTLPLPLDELPDAAGATELVPFHWRVRATDGAGNVGPWSVTWTVTKAPDARGLLGGVTAALPPDALPTPVPDVPALDVAFDASSERAHLSVLGISGALLAKDVAVRVDGTLLRLGADASHATFEVHPPRDPSFPLAPGDSLVVPVVGEDVPVVVVHVPSGAVLAALNATVTDATPPATPLPLDPLAGEIAEGPVTLSWTASEDLSGVTYDVIVTTDATYRFSAGVHAAYGLTGTDVVTDLAELPSPPDADAPGTVWWTVRAVDDAGNASEWAPPVKLVLS